VKIGSKKQWRHAADGKLIPFAELKGAEAISFDSPHLSDCIFTNLKSATLSFGPKSGEEDITIKVGEEAIPGSWAVFCQLDSFDIHGAVKRRDELGLGGPREAALDGGVADVEAHAAVGGVEVADETEHIPDGRADVVVSGVILKTGLEAEVFAGGGEVAQAQTAVAA